MPTYRQRLTAAGKFGLALMLLCPFAAGLFTRDPDTHILAAICVSAITLGGALCLIGREYYDATDEMEMEAKERADLKATDKEKREKFGR